MAQDSQAQPGDVVQVHYTGKLADGSVFDSSSGREPLEFKIGDGRILPRFEDAVIGMNPGESKTATIPADDAYGPHRAEMVLTVDRHDFPEHVVPEVGQRLQIRDPSGPTTVVTVTEISHGSVTLDANHPLAGQALTFEIELVGIR